MNLRSKIAKKAWCLSPVSKVTMSEEILQELIQSFVKFHNDVVVKKTSWLDCLDTWRVVAEVDNELISLYDEWNNNFERHGYEPPFVIFHQRT